MGKKYDHMTLAINGVVMQTESASVSIQNVTGKERTFFATTSGKQGFSTKRVVTMIKGKVVFQDGSTLDDLDIANARITLRDTESGNRMVCDGCYTGTIGEIGKDNPEIMIGVTGNIMEL